MIKLKEKSGITLISLIVTIIILMILAGVAAGSLMQESSIINQSGNAKERIEEFDGQAQVNLLIQEWKMGIDQDITTFLNRKKSRGEIDSFEEKDGSYIVVINGKKGIIDNLK